MHPEYQRYRKLGGWLLFFLVLQALMLWGSITSIHHFFTQPEQAKWLGLKFFTLTGGFLYNLLALLPLQLLTLFFLFQRRAVFRIFYCVQVIVLIPLYYQGNIAFLLLDLLPCFCFILYLFTSIRVNVYCAIKPFDQE